MREYTSDGKTLLRETSFFEGSEKIYNYSEYCIDGKMKKYAHFESFESYLPDNNEVIVENLPTYIQTITSDMDGATTTRTIQFESYRSIICRDKELIKNTYKDKTFNGNNGYYARAIEKFSEETVNKLETKTTDYAFDVLSTPRHCAQEIKHADGSSERFVYHTFDYKKNYAPETVCESKKVPNKESQYIVHDIIEDKEAMPGEKSIEEIFEKTINGNTEKYFVSDDGNWVKK